MKISLCHLKKICLGERKKKIEIIFITVIKITVFTVFFSSFVLYFCLNFIEIILKRTREREREKEIDIETEYANVGKFSF